jgi:hypothetical protein
MKINEKFSLYLITASQAHYRCKTKYRSGMMEENHFISLIFTLWASRRLAFAALFRAKHSLLSLRPEVPCI